MPKQVRPTRLLIVEDDPSMQATLARAARRRWGSALAVISVSDRGAAVDAAVETKFDAAILDVRLGGETVHTAIPRLRELLGNAALVAFSGTVSREEAFRLGRLGVDILCEKGSKNAVDIVLQAIDDVTLNPPGPFPETDGEGFRVLENAREQMVRSAFVSSNGNKSAAARKLGISVKHLRYYLKKYGI